MSLLQWRSVTLQNTLLMEHFWVQTSASGVSFTMTVSLAIACRAPTGGHASQASGGADSFPCVLVSMRNEFCDSLLFLFEGVWCEAPVSPTNGKLISAKSQYEYGESVGFACDPGHVMKGIPKLRCEEDKLNTFTRGGGVWNEEPPTCEGKVDKLSVSVLSYLRIKQPSVVEIREFLWMESRMDLYTIIHMLSDFPAYPDTSSKDHLKSNASLMGPGRIRCLHALV